MEKECPLLKSAGMIFRAVFAAVSCMNNFEPDQKVLDYIAEKEKCMGYKCPWHTDSIYTTESQQLPGGCAISFLPHMDSNGHFVV